MPGPDSPDRPEGWPDDTRAGEAQLDPRSAASFKRAQEQGLGPIPERHRKTGTFFLSEEDQLRIIAEADARAAALVERATHPWREEGPGGPMELLEQIRRWVDRAFVSQVTATQWTNLGLELGEVRDRLRAECPDGVVRDGFLELAPCEWVRAATVMAEYEEYVAAHIESPGSRVPFRAWLAQRGHEGAAMPVPSGPTSAQTRAHYEGIRPQTPREYERLSARVRMMEEQVFGLADKPSTGPTVPQPVPMRTLILAQRCEKGHGCRCRFEETTTAMIQLSGECCVHGEVDCDYAPPAKSDIIQSPYGRSKTEEPSAGAMLAEEYRVAWVSGWGAAMESVRVFSRRHDGSAP